MRKIYNTNVKIKKENWSKFSKLIENQFIHGGDKYKITDDSDEEVTDWLCKLSPGKTGADWILQTICKYTGRFKNFMREKDLLKIATYTYIMWLKMGFHLTNNHDEDTDKEKKDVEES